MNKELETRATQVLYNHALRKTAMRMDVLQVFLDKEEIALSNQELEAELEDSDRVTLYRTLKTFEKKGIIHQAIDGSGTNKYAMCHADCSEHEHVDNHAHFHCTQCEKTLCLEQIDVPQVEVPSGYTVQTSYMVIQGQCNQCSS
jgi:Fur family ferric uptake transcriptional regulator